jgi:hypothetical protein
MQGLSTLMMPRDKFKIHKDEKREGMNTEQMGHLITRRKGHG